MTHDTTNPRIDIETDPRMRTGNRRTATPEQLELQKRNFEWFMAWLRYWFADEPKRSTARVCWTRLVRGVGCPTPYGKDRTHRCRTPQSDHLNLWTAGGVAVALTSEPYWDVDDWRAGGTLDVERQWAEQHGLDLHVFDRSWWNPGGTVLLVFTAKEDREGTR